MQLVWQDHDRNEWATTIREALTAGTASPAPTTNHPGPFSLGDPAITADILAAAGFAEVAFTEVHKPVFYGPDTATAYEAVLRLRHAKDLLADLDPTKAGHTLERLRATVAAHDTDSGVFLGRGPGSSPPSGDQTVRHVNVGENFGESFGIGRYRSR